MRVAVRDCLRGRVRFFDRAVAVVSGNTTGGGRSRPGGVRPPRPDRAAGAETAGTTLRGCRDRPCQRQQRRTRHPAPAGSAHDRIAALAVRGGVNNGAVTTTNSSAAAPTWPVNPARGSGRSDGSPSRRWRGSRWGSQVTGPRWCLRRLRGRMRRGRCCPGRQPHALPPSALPTNPIVSSPPHPTRTQGQGRHLIWEFLVVPVQHARVPRAWRPGSVQSLPVALR